MRLALIIMIIFAFISSFSSYPSDGPRKHKILWAVIVLLITASLVVFMKFAIRQDELLKMQVIDESKTFVGIEIDANGSRFIFE